MESKTRKYYFKSYYFIITALFCSVQAVLAVEKTNLVLVQVLYRHGDRSPVTGYPSDTFKEDQWQKFGAQGFGQLTWVGMKQQYNLGQYFKKTYIDDKKFLNGNYDRNEIYVRSTDVDRTLMSAYCNLAGMFPPNNTAPTTPWDVNHTMNWQPIPVHTVSNLQDNLLSMDTDCAEADHLYRREQQTSRYLNYTKQYQGFFKFLSNKTGMPHENLDNLWQTIDTLYCKVRHNITLPDWSTVKTYQWDKNNETTVYDLLMSLQTWEFDLKYEEPAKKAKLRGGPLLKKMLENMKTKIDGKIQQKMKFYMYSAHDNTVTAFLSALKVYNRMLPQYASTVILELYHNDTAKEYSVKIGYKNDTLENPNIVQDLIIPGCTVYCPYKKFVNLTANMVPEDWHEECKIKAETNNRNAIMIIGIGVGGGILLLLVFVGIVYLIRKRRTGYGEYYGINDADA